MAEQVVSDAFIFPRDGGIAGVSDGEESWHSAGYVAMMAEAVKSGSYVRSDSELTFTNHDGTNDQVDVTGGVAYLSLDGETVNVQTTLGGSSEPTHDTSMASLPLVMVHLPTTVADVDLQDSTLSDVWLAFDTDGTGPGSAGSVYVRSDDTGSVTAPSHPSVKLGSVNPDDSGADVLSNRGPSPTFDTSRVTDTSSITVNVPTDFSTVADAIDDIRQLRVPYGTRITINIESGHTFQTDVEISHEYLGHVWIESEDATVPVDSSVGVIFRVWFGSTAPTLDCLFDGSGASVDRGLQLNHGSKAHMRTGAGFDNVSGRGIEMIGGCTLSCQDGIISRNCGDRGISVTGGYSSVRAQNADFSNCDLGVRTSVSSVDIRGSDVSGSRIGVRATRGSMVEAANTTATGCSEHGISVHQAATANAMGSDVSNATDADVDAAHGSVVRLHGATTTNGSPDVGDTTATSFNDVTVDGIIFA